MDRASGVRRCGESQPSREMVVHGVARRAATHQFTAQVDRQPGGGGLPHAPPDDLRLGRQHELQTILWLACGIVEQHILRPRADVNGEDRTVHRGKGGRVAWLTG